MVAAIKVTDLEYHRNGVGGVGFVTARFTFREDGKKFSAIATVFNGDDDDAKFTGYCAVLVEDAKGKVDIHSCWRGDHFEIELRRFIESDEGRVMMFPTVYPNVAAARAERDRLNPDSVFGPIIEARA